MADSAPANDSNGNGSSLNPFAKKDSHSDQSILLYKITTTISWLLLVVSAIYTTFASPNGPNSHKFWHNNPSTPFAQSSIFTSIYVLIIFILQSGYAYALYMSDTTYVTSAANLGSHFIANNLLLFGFVFLFTHMHYWLALFLLVLNFGNLSMAYFRHSTAPRAIHIGTVSGPLAWNFVALYWVGAIAVHSNHFAARIVANVFIWGWLGYGMFFLVAYKDYTMGFALSVLCFCKFRLFACFIEGIFANLASSNRRWTVPYPPASLPAPVDLCFHNWWSALLAFTCCRHARFAWTRSFPSWPDRQRG
jgi:hypothetical protein